MKAEMPRSQSWQIRFRLATKVLGEGSAAKLSNKVIAQFLCSSVVPPTPAHLGGRIHLFRKCSETLDHAKGERTPPQEKRDGSRLRWLYGRPAVQPVLAETFPSSR
jgi:hypothetical protein